MEYRNAVYTCARLNANAVAAVPRKLYVQTGKGEPRPKCGVRGLSRKAEVWVRASSSTTGRVVGDPDIEEVTDHPLLELLSKPNPWMSQHFLAKLTCIYSDVVGSAFWWVGDRKGRLGIPNTIWPLQAHQVQPFRPGGEDGDPDQLVESYYYTSYKRQWHLRPEDIVHFREINLLDPYTSGFSPVQAIMEHINVSQKMIGHMQSLLDNQARPDALVSPGEVIGHAEANRLEYRLNSKFRNAGMGGLFVAESDMKVQPFSWSPIDLAIIEIGGLNRDYIFDAFQVPQALATKDTNLANLQAARGQHAQDAVLPRCQSIDETINRTLIPLYDDSGRLFVACDNPVKPDSEYELKKQTAAVTGGWMLRSEARAADGLEPAEWAEKPTLASSIQVLGDDGTPAAPLAPVGPDGKPVGGKGDEQGGKGPGAAGASGGGGKPGGGDSKRPGGRQGGKPAAARKPGLRKPGDKRPAKPARRKALSRLMRLFRAAHTKAAGGETGETGQHVQWLRPRLKGKDFEGEIDRACAELKEEGWEVTPKELVRCAKAGRLEKLSDEVWDGLVNDESRKVRKLRDVIAIAHRRQVKARKILGDYLAGEVRSPVILALPDGKFFRQDGGTRLAVAHLFGVRPKVWMVEVPAEGGGHKAVRPAADPRRLALRALAALPAVDGEDGVPLPWDGAGVEVAWGEAPAPTPTAKALDASGHEHGPDGRFGHTGGQGPKPEPAAVPEQAPSEKAARAKAAHVPVGKDVQRYSEERNELVLAAAIGGVSFPDGEPVDVAVPAKASDRRQWQAEGERWRKEKGAGGKPAPMKVEGKPGHGIELKTMTQNGNGKLTMDTYSQVRKLEWEREKGATFHTVVFDDTAVFNAGGPGKHDESKRRILYRRGVAGSARVGGLHECKDEAELRRLMNAPEDKLPSAAQRTDGHLRVGRWEFFEDEHGKGYRNAETGHVARAKK